MISKMKMVLCCCEKRKQEDREKEAKLQREASLCKEAHEKIRGGLCPPKPELKREGLIGEDIELSPELHQVSGKVDGVRYVLFYMHD